MTGSRGNCRADRFCCWLLILIGVVAETGVPMARAIESEPEAAETAIGVDGGELPGEPQPPVAPPEEVDAPAAPETPAAAADTEATEAPAASDATDLVPPAAAPAEPRADRVRATIDVSGELFAPAGRDAPPVRRPIVVEGRFDFIETPIAAAEEPTVERRYVDAAADLRIDGESQRTTLADDARVVRVVLRGTTPAPHLSGGFLSRAEMDLLEMPFDPMLIDALRPAAAVAAGDSWEIGGDVTAGLLAIDTVESGGLEAGVETVEDGRAIVKLSGIVDGAADGVPTHVTVEGSFMVPVDGEAGEPHALAERVATLTMTVRERREASHVSPGFDVEARIVVARTAAESDVAELAATTATAASAAEPGRRQGVGRPGLVWHRDAVGRYDLVHDERWRVIEEGTEGLVMRLVDRGALVAQCSITALPRSSALSPPTIAEVERDIERSLAGQFSRIEHASEASRSDGVRIVRVVTSGRADDLPFRWIHHVLTDSAGHRLAVTCMLEEPLAKRFGTADRELVDGIMFPAVEAESTPETAGAEGPPADREARLPTESRTP
jgi:hypothetical protein